MKVKKLLVTILVAVIFSISTQVVGHASELNTNGAQPNQNTNSDELSDISAGDKLQVQLNNTNSDINNLNKESADDQSDLEATPTIYYDEDGRPFIYQMFLDEQNQVCKEKRYLDEPIGEPVNNDDEDIKEDAKNDAKPKEKASYSEQDLRLLACLIYSEAGNQPYQGMLAVANVVLNRIKSDAYWHVNTVKEVIYDNKWSVQFAVTIKNRNTGLSPLDKALKCYDTGKYPSEGYKKSMQKCIKAAKAALEGENNIGSYLCFTVNNKYANSIKRNYNYKIIGAHIFYRTK